MTTPTPPANNAARVHVARETLTALQSGHSLHRGSLVYPLWNSR